jgi:inorganic phosphate transporter, PiT family
VIGVIYSAYHLLSDLSVVHIADRSCLTCCWASRCWWLWAFEFVNGFHDTANAVATVIYTHSLEPHVAVVWSGFWNFLGV